jgi:hypothetical protein
MTGPSVVTGSTASGSGSGTGLTTSKTLGQTPTAGNLLIAHIFTGSGVTPSTLTFDTTKWTPFERSVSDTDTNQVITSLFRYVQGGDTSALPAFCTAGSAFHAWTVQEIQGVNGTWANDYQSSRYKHSSAGVSSMTTPKDTTRSANALGLLAFGKYNASANATLDAAWTSDVNSNNSGNYGSFGCAHQAVSSADTDIFATNSFQAGGNPTGMVMVILNGAGAAPTKPYLVRYRSKQSASAGFPGTVQFGGAPLSGHSLVAALSWQDGSQADPTIGGSWSTYLSVTQGAHHQMFGLDRDVSGDTSVLAAIATAGNAFWALIVAEIGGMTGVFATDKLNDKSGSESSAATVTTTSDTTSGVNQMTLTFASEYNTSTNLSETGALYDETNGVASATTYGAFSLAFDFHASSGGTNQTVWTKASSGDKFAYIQSRFGAGASTETGTAIMAFGGIAFNASGSSALAGTGAMHFAGISMAGAGNVTNFGSAVMAFAGISFVASGTAKHTGTGAMHFSGITITSQGFDTGASPSPLVPGVSPSGVAQKNLEPLQWNVSIVDPRSGYPSPELQRKWKKNFDIINDQAKVNTQIVSQDYIDTQDTATLAAAATFATAQASAAQAAAQAYTDAKVANHVYAPCPVASLPTGVEGDRGFVTDSNQTLAAGLGTNVANGGTNHVPVFKDNTSWKIG